MSEFRPDAERRRRAARSLARIRPTLAKEAEKCLGRPESVAFLARLDGWFADVHAPVEALYGESRPDDDVDALVERLVRLALVAASERPTPLRELDRRREIEPRWFQHPRMIGYVAYVDRFCGTLDALPSRLDYLEEL
ncbi:MAG TPA: hypothetical protein VD813_11680, partial [Pseudonocardia sp.]|nr:hypothetical protein [Pseudonocardia sp.]